jgi:hypothetical protein
MMHVHVAYVISWVIVVVLCVFVTSKLSKYDGTGLGRLFAILIDTIIILVGILAHIAITSVLERL